MAPRLRHWLAIAVPSSFAVQVVAQDAVSSNNIATGPLNYTAIVDSPKYHRIVIAHAALACLAWVLFAPLGAIFLRSGLRRVNLLKLHAFWQLAVFAMYITATGLGIWMRLQLSSNGAVWRYPHAAIGLLVLIGAFFQPWLGYIHHKIFKRRLKAIDAGNTTKKLGRTIITHLHLCLGRLLITLGMINGGLGIMVTWDRQSPLQSAQTSKRAAIAYGAVAGSFFLIYAAFMFRHEYQRAPLVLDTGEGASPVEESSTRSDRSNVQSIEIGRRFSVFLDDMPEGAQRRGSSNRSRNSNNHSTKSSNEKLMAAYRAHSPNFSPIEEVKTP